MTTKVIALKLNVNKKRFTSFPFNNSNGEERARSKFKLRKRCIDSTKSARQRNMEGPGRKQPSVPTAKWLCTMVNIIILTFNLICSGIRSAWYVSTNGSQYRLFSLRACLRKSYSYVQRTKSIDKHVEIWEASPYKKYYIWTFKKFGHAESFKY